MRVLLAGAFASIAVGLAVTILLAGAYADPLSAMLVGGLLAWALFSAASGPGRRKGGRGVGALAVHGEDQPALAQQLDSLARRAAGHPELLLNGRLARDRPVRRNRPVPDQPLDPVRHLYVERYGTVRVDHAESLPRPFVRDRQGASMDE